MFEARNRRIIGADPPPTSRNLSTEFISTIDSGIEEEPPVFENGRAVSADADRGESILCKSFTSSLRAGRFPSSRARKTLWPVIRG